jgi:hypothetical protein
MSNILIYWQAIAFVAGGVGWDSCWFRGAPGGAGNGTLLETFFMCL